MNKGVYEHKKKNGEISYRASVTYRGRHISLGSYPDGNVAESAYREALSLISQGERGIEQYTGESSLYFEKWVVLTNFRDDGLYIPTPIYLKSKYFEYYLSREKVLKFDRDDLFYYSSHKIMERGGRLFVADYGSQMAITLRYGIMPYGVEGRDYRFVNGDNRDFRYENIEVFNIYRGVNRQKHRGAEAYRARIHIKGDVVIGYYATETEAALAYNKAVDILTRDGCGRDYTKNYIANLSEEEQKSIYDSLEISPAIYRYAESAL